VNAVQLPLVVEAVLLLVAMAFGAALGLRAKPYGKVKLSFHLFFFLWFATGYYFVAQAVWSSHGWNGPGIAVLVMGIALLVQLATGLRMLVSKKPRNRWPIVHGVSAGFVLVADIAAFLLSGS